MKTRILLLTSLLLAFYCAGLSGKEASDKNNPSRQGAIRIDCTPDLYELASTWASEYSNLNPGLTIQVNQVQNGQIALKTSGNIAFICTEGLNSLDEDPNWKMTVGRDVIVPVTSAKNPFLAEISQQGISSGTFARIFNDPAKQVWGTLVSKGQNEPVNLYVINDESVKAGVTKFLKVNQLPINGIIFTSKEEMITAIQNDPYAIGFIKLVNITDEENQCLVENIRFLPIDKNGNGTLDYMEQIYGDLNAFARGVWIGKYPKALTSDIFLVSGIQPANETEIAFLKWILTDGQQFLNQQGYSDLVYNERLSKLDTFNTVAISVPQSKDFYSRAGIALAILLAVVIISFTIGGVLRYRSDRKIPVPVEAFAPPLIFDEGSVVVPNGLYFDKTHTWAFMEKDGTVKMGIDDFLQHVTGPITRIEMKNPGEMIKKGQPVLSIIQKGKQLKIYAPISGTIKEQNKALLTHSSRINSSPYAEGWIYAIEPIHWSRETQFLQMAEIYKKWLSGEFTRLKDFLSVTFHANQMEYAHLVLQDGGALKDNVLEDLGPEVWEDFQTNFLDICK